MRAKIRAQPAVVLLAKHINIVCSVPLLIKEIYNAEGPSPVL